MHILLLIVLVVAVVFIIKKQQSSSVSIKTEAQGVFSNDQSGALLDSSVLGSSNLAYLSKGKLFSKNNDQLEEIHCTHIQNLIDRAEKNNERHGWKQGTSWGTTPLGGVRQCEDNAIDVKFTATEILPNNKILYF